MTRWLLVPLLLPALLGCVRPWGPADLARDLSRSAGVELDREFGITIGRSGMWIVRMVTSNVDDVSLRGVHRIQVGVYGVTGLRKGLNEVGQIPMPELPGWTSVVRVHEAGEAAFVLIREENGKVRDLLVIAADHDEWVLVKLKGKLDRMLEDAIRMAFDRADRPDLYAKTRVERGLPRLGSADAIEPLSPDPSD